MPAYDKNLTVYEDLLEYFAASTDKEKMKPGKAAICDLGLVLRGKVVYASAVATAEKKVKKELVKDVMDLDATGKDDKWYNILNVPKGSTATREEYQRNVLACDALTSIFCNKAEYKHLYPPNAQVRTKSKKNNPIVLQVNYYRAQVNDLDFVSRLDKVNKYKTKWTKAFEETGVRKVNSPRKKRKLWILIWTRLRQGICMKHSMKSLHQILEWPLNLVGSNLFVAI